MHLILRMHFLTWQIRFAAVVALSTGIFLPTLAQDVNTIRLSPEDATRGFNGAQHNFDFLAPGAEGDKYQTAGFFGQRLRPYLAGNPEALASLDRYRRQKTIYLIDRLVAVSSFGVYGQQIFAHGDPQYFNNNQKVALGVFATSVLATVFINRNTNSYLQRAVKMYNESPDGTGGAFWQRLRPTFIGLGAAPTGQPLLALRWTVR